MDHAIDQRDALLERRIRLGIRLVFYPVAIVLIVLAWHQRQSSPAHAHPVSWRGVTAQGRPIRAVTSGGVLTSVDTEVPERCVDGSVFTLHMHLGGRNFAQQGKNVTAAFRGPGQSFGGEPVL